MNTTKLMSKLNLEVTTSRHFSSWLQEQQLGLAFTTYLAGKLFLIGSKPDGRLTVFNRDFQRVMGLCSPRQGTIWLTTLYQVWRLEDVLRSGESYGDFEQLFVPRMAYVTGDLDAHDIVVGNDGVPIFVNTLFSCLARPGDVNNFEAVWRPPFISRLAAEDRCHLNGLAMENGEPRYVTAVSTTNVHGGWREHRRDGGVIIDVKSGETVTSGLSMPHSPRLHRGKLYVLDSGSGYFGEVDRTSGEFNTIAFTPGYSRGMAFHGDFAIIGLSKCRANKVFTGLALDDKLSQKGVAPRCGVQVVDLRTGDSVHSLELDGDVEEIYDVAVLPGACAPAAIGLGTDEIQRMIRGPECDYGE